MAKKKKKKGLAGDVPAVVKTAGNNLLKYTLAAVGLIGGIIVLRNVPKLNNATLDKILPGGAAILAAYYLSQQSSQYAKTAAWGVGGAGAVDLLRKVLGDKFPSLTDLLPQLNGFSMQGMRGLRGFSMQGLRGGMRGPMGSMSMQGNTGTAINVGDFPPSYYWVNSFQGVAKAPSYSLNKPASYALNKPGSYALS
jgi:hypothetical protein